MRHSADYPDDGIGDTPRATVQGSPSTVVT